MAYDKLTHVKESTLLPMDLDHLVRAEASKERRSVSAQIVYIIEHYYSQRGVPYELEITQLKHTKSKELR